MPVTLESMKLKGLRSYSPREDRAQFIEFVPLSLIVGSNGSGKTTIVEALKFMISGDEPPLSDSRRNFLNSSGTHASIELKFRNSRHEICTARREISTTATMKSGAPTITSSYKIGRENWVAVHKQDDWNKTMPLLLNMPNPAILNNVVLCHQEENLWCLSDSSSVKQTFDKIFGCEKYKKEIKHIDAEIKARKVDLTIVEKDLLRAKDAVQMLNSAKDELESRDKELDSIQNSIKKIDEQIERLEEKRRTFQEKIKAADILKSELDSLNTSVFDLKKKISQSKSTIGADLLNMSKSELEKEVDVYASQVTKLESERNNSFVEQKSLHPEIEKLEKEQRELDRNVIEQRYRFKTFQETKKVLLNDLAAIKEEYDLIGFDFETYDQCIKVLKEQESRLLDDKSQQAETEDNLSCKNRELGREIMQNEVTQQKLQQQLVSTENSINRLSAELSKADPLAKKLNEVSSNLREMSDQLPKMSPQPLVCAMMSLVEKSQETIHEILNQVHQESVIKLSEEIKRERDEQLVIQRKLEKAQADRVEASSKQTEAELAHSKARGASKEAHNRAMKFENVKSRVLDKINKLKSEQHADNVGDIERKEQRSIELVDCIKSKRCSYQELSDRIRELSTTIDSMRGKKLNIERALCHASMICQLEEIEGRIAIIKDDKTFMKAEDAKAELMSVEKESMSLRCTRSMLGGKISEIEKEVARCKIRIQEYRSADMSYAKILAKSVCAEMIVNDLEKLKACLNSSITSFHNQMIVKINEVLKAKWRQIYQGTDIERIELVDEEITKGKDKKSYNYYLALRKKGIRMKMREKSSAGQRALASIILRMALAELFVKDHAFIALDEPTANLDHANVKALAKAICSYVRKRANTGANIQWIIITHDEHFLSALDAESSPYYYKVHLDGDGFSTIDKVSFDAIQADSRESK